MQVKFTSRWLDWSPEVSRETHRSLPPEPTEATSGGSVGTVREHFESGRQPWSRDASVIRTENQCGQCLAWRLSVLVQLDRGQQIYLCPECAFRHRSSHRRPA